MRQLTPDCALDLVNTVYASVDRRGDWRSLLLTIAGALEIPCVGVIARGPDGRALPGFVSESEDRCVDYLVHWMDRDRRIPRFLARASRRPGQLFSDRDLFEDSELRLSPLHNEYFRPMGVGDFFGGCIRAGGSEYFFFGCLPLGDGGPRNREDPLLHGLFGHLVRAVRIWIDTECRAALDRTVLDAAGGRRGIVVVDRAGTVVHVSSAAFAVLGSGLSVVDGRLRLAEAEANKAVQGLLRAALAPGAEGRFGPVSIDRAGRPPVLAEALSAGPDGDAADVAALGALPGGAVLIMTDPETVTRAPDERFRRLGLTPAEARLAALIGAGRTPAEAARDLGISIGTARTTLSTVFAKLKVSRQPALVGLAAALVC